MTTLYRDLGPPEEIEEPVEDDEDVEFEDEYDPFAEFDTEGREFIDALIKRIILFCEEFSEYELRPYQREMAYRVIESLIISDGEEITALWCRQSGKSETLSIIISGCMVLFPKLAMAFPLLEKFKRGLWIGCFAPTDDQSGFIFKKIVDKLSSDHAVGMLRDPEIDDQLEGRTKLLTLRSGSYCRRQTANPRAKIDGATYHLIVLDEAQDADDTVVRRAIHPMLASVAGTMVKIGTPAFHKNDFYRAIQKNKRHALKKRARTNHFEYDHHVVSKYNKYYGKFIQQEKIRLGEDSNEFLMSYEIKWQLDRGMLVTDEELNYLCDPKMQTMRSWHLTPVVVGIDPARIHDSTVVTVCWVDWDHPDPAGYREHRVLNWLEIQNTEWEEQYYQVMEFLDGYNIVYVGIDAQGMGSAVAERFRLLLGGRCEVFAVNSDIKTQTERWKHLIALMQRRMIMFPGHSKTRRTKTWKRFRQQMEDAEKVMKGQYMLIQAPEDERDARDDYVDSLALACSMSMELINTEVEQMEAPWFR